jgi:hypothetical protein
MKMNFEFYPYFKFLYGVYHNRKLKKLDNNCNFSFILKKVGIRHRYKKKELKCKEQVKKLLDQFYLEEKEIEGKKYYLATEKLRNYLLQKEYPVRSCLLGVLIYIIIPLASLAPLIFIIKTIYKFIKLGGVW